MLNRPAPTFEDRLFRAFPGSEWIFTQSDPQEGQQLDPTQHPGILPTSAIAVIGGANFDEASLVTWLRALPRDVILVTAQPRLTKDGVYHAADFGGKLATLAAPLGLRVDFVAKKEDRYGTYAQTVQYGEILRVTGGDVVVVGSGAGPKWVKDLAGGDWAMAKAVLNGRELKEVA